MGVYFDESVGAGSFGLLSPVVLLEESPDEGSYVVVGAGSFVGVGEGSSVGAGSYLFGPEGTGSLVDESLVDG